MPEKMIKSRRQFPDTKYFLSLIEWKRPSTRRTEMKISRAQTINDLARIAKKKVPKVVFDYVEGGSLTELGYSRSRKAFSNIQFNVGVLKDVSEVDPSTIIFEQSVDLPIIFAPTGYSRFMYHVGEPAVAAIAERSNMIYILSTMGTTSPEDLALAVPGVRRWFQIYLMRNRNDSLDLIKQAYENGFEALVLTVDTPVSGLRLRDIRNGLTIPPRIRLSTIFAIARKPMWWINLLTTKKLEFAAFRGWDRPLSELAATIFDPATTFEDIEWLKSVWKGPIIVKGVQSVEDAKQLAKIGVQGIVLSNHGGRQLDLGPTPLELLPDVINAVGNKMDVYIDGGVMSGQDAYAAIAMGAKAVFIGRAYLYGLMAGGERGVERVIEILHRDFVNVMALCGNRSIPEVQALGASIRYH
jgi:L-lactate dehydrogenase (cytochrome)